MSEQEKYEQAKRDLRYGMEHFHDVEIHWDSSFHSAIKAINRGQAYLRPYRDKYPLLWKLLGNVRRRWIEREMSRPWNRQLPNDRQRARLGTLSESEG